MSLSTPTRAGVIQSLVLAGTKDPSSLSSRRHSGYVLLTVVFLCALMLIAVATATPPILNQGRREKEAELVWRGEQYARSVRLYYRKNGRFPQNVEDLVEPQNGLRYLRQAYKEPMNREDGSWRFIYMGPNGQLVGSLKRQNLLLPQGFGGAPSPPGMAGNPPAGPPGGAPPKQQEDESDDQPDKEQTPVIPPDTLTGKVFGGSIIGVASKVNRPSLRIYEKGKTYIEWEFIWDPTKDAPATGQPIQPGGQPPQPGAPIQPLNRPPNPNP